jgi:cell division protein FtsB
MRDIGARIQRYRLSRYAPPVDQVRRRLRWAWLAAALWLVWVGFVSDHNFVRLWQLSHERQRSEVELRRVSAEAARLDAQIHDPAEQRESAERALRNRGMAKPTEIIYQVQPKRRTQP